MALWLICSICFEILIKLVLCAKRREGATLDTVLYRVQAIEKIWIVLYGIEKYFSDAYAVMWKVCV